MFLCSFSGNVEDHLIEPAVILILVRVLVGKILWWVEMVDVFLPRVQAHPPPPYIKEVLEDWRGEGRAAGFRVVFVWSKVRVPI